MVINIKWYRPLLLLITIVGIMFSMPSFAQVYATVSKNRVNQNELFQLRIVVDKKLSSDELDFSKLDRDFQTLGRPSFGTSLNIINGTRSTRSEWTINIAAKRTGIVTIPAFTVDGERSQPIAMQVTADNSVPNNKDLVEIQTYFDDMTLYPKQSTIMHVKLIIKADARRLQDPQITPPSAKGVQLESASEPDQQQKLINGVESTIVKQDFRISALKPGSFTVIEPQFKGQLLYSGYRGDTRMIPLNTKAKSFTISVLDKPSQYKGVWLPTSKLSLNQQWQDSAGQEITDNPVNIAVGDPITRIITLEVRGVSQEQVPTLTVNYPKTLRVYSEKPHYKALDNGDLSMTLKQVLIPNQSGHITLPGLTLNWWDTKAKKQRTTLLSTLDLNVSGQSISAQSALPPVTSSQPETTCNVATKDNNDGVWPFIAIGFGVLWLVTIATWVYRTKHSPAHPDKAHQSSDEVSDNFTMLKQAIKENDGFKVNALLMDWMAESSISPEQKRTIEQVKQQWFSNRYSSTPSEETSEVFLQTITKINKTRGKKISKLDDVLPKL